MRTVYIEKNYFNHLDLLSPENSELKQKVLEKYSHINVEHDWHESVYINFKTMTALQHGFLAYRIYFRGFGSQGDGAMFEGCVNDFTKFVSDTRIKRLIQNGTIGFDMQFKHRGNYYHEKSYNANMVESDYTTIDENLHPNIYNYLEKLESEIKEQYETICKQLYRMLEQEYDYLTSDEAIMQTIESNGYEFDSDGNIF